MASSSSSLCGNSVVDADRSVWTTNTLNKRLLLQLWGWALGWNPLDVKINVLRIVTDVSVGYIFVNIKTYFEEGRFEGTDWMLLA